MRTLAAEDLSGPDDLDAAARAFFEFATADPQRYQLLFQRTIPGFEPSAESWAVAVELFDEMRRGFVRMGIVDDAALDLWTALLTGLTDQQISNDPGGDRWARLIDGAVAMFTAHIAAVSSTSRRER